MRLMTLALFLLCISIGYAGNQKNEEGTIHLTKAEFLKKVVDYENNVNEWIYLGDKPAIIDFYTDWCGPCRKLSPILEEIAAELKGEVYIYKVNADKEHEIAQAFGIRALPTLFFVPANGKPTIVEGFMPKEELYKAINTTILKKEK